MNKLMHGIVPRGLRTRLLVCLGSQEGTVPLLGRIPGHHDVHVVLLMLPTFLALYLPIINLLVRLPHDRWRRAHRPLSPHENHATSSAHRG